MSILNFVINFVVIFIGLSLANLIIKILPIENWFLEMCVTVLVVMGMLYLATVLVQRINKKY